MNPQVGCAFLACMRLSEGRAAKIIDTLNLITLEGLTKGVHYRIKSRWTIAYETVDGLRHCLLEGMPMILLFFDL